MLSKINSHPRDSNITFEEEGHVYTIEGMSGHPISVTTVIHKFFPEFDADKIIDNMMRGKKWESSKYYGMSREEIKQQWKQNGETASKLGTAMHKAIEDYINNEVTPEIDNIATSEEIDKAIEDYFNDEATSKINNIPTLAETNEVISKMYNIPTLEENNKAIEATTNIGKIPTLEEIDKASNFYGEIFELNIPTIEEQTIPMVFPKVPDVSTQTREFELFLKFWEGLKIGSPGFRAYRTEWLVYDMTKRLSGSIDLTLVNEKGDIIICDWKRSKEIKKSNLYQKGFKIFAHLDDCNYNHYCLQLNIYRHILETHYEKNVVGMFLVVLHPNNDDYILIQVPRLQEEILALWNELPLDQSDSH